MAQKRTVMTDKAPRAIGPYSQAVAVDVGRLVFTSGQIPVDPRTGQVVAGGIEVQTKQALDNLAAVLEASGSGLDRVVKTTVFLKDMNDFTAMNQIYKTFFSTDPPARSTVQVPRLPRDVLVEIECTALADS